MNGNTNKEIVLAVDLAVLADILEDAHAIDGEWGIDNGTRLPEWHDILAKQVGGCAICKQRRERAALHGWSYG